MTFSPSLSNILSLLSQDSVPMYPFSLFLVSGPLSTVLHLCPLSPVMSPFLSLCFLSSVLCPLSHVSIPCLPSCALSQVICSLSPILLFPSPNPYKLSQCPLFCGSIPLFLYVVLLFPIHCSPPSLVLCSCLPYLRDCSEFFSVIYIHTVHL